MTGKHVATSTFDTALMEAFGAVLARDGTEMDSRSLVSNRFPEASRGYKYRLRERALWRLTFHEPIFALAMRRAGPILASFGATRFATDICVDAGAGEPYGFTTVLNGGITLVQSGEAMAATSASGLAFRSEFGTKLSTSSDSVRHTVFIDARELESGLEQMLDDRLRAPLAFRPNLEWGDGLASSLKSQLAFVAKDFRRADGVAGDPMALASLTDLLVSLTLRRVPHNHSDRLQPDSYSVRPAAVRRAEEFMRQHSTTPIRMRDVAAAAGCSVRTLSALFRQFRERSPLAVLHAIRLEQAKAALRASGGDETIASVARRFGFTNASRFASAYTRRFGERPAVRQREDARR